MATPSPQPPPPVSPMTRPLWIIAVSLAAIAICLVLITIRMQLDRSKAVTMASNDGVAGAGDSSRKPDQPPRERRTYVRPQPVPEGVEVPPPASLEVSVTNVELALVETIIPSRGFEADVNVVAGTNPAPGIVGRITLRGTPPVEFMHAGSNRPPCLESPSMTPLNPVFRVGHDGALADVIVAISTGLEGRRFPVPPTNHVWTFTNCQIHPKVSVVRAGQRVGLVSGDGELHLLQFTSAAGTNVGKLVRNLSRVEPGEWNSRPWTPINQDLVQFKCFRHPWETAAFAAYDHPFFAITDTNGNFAIPRVPAGKYTLRAMHRGLPGTNEISQVVTVNSGEISVVNFTIDSPARKVPASNLSAQAGGAGMEHFRQ